MEKRLASITHPMWVDAITSLILRSGAKHFRWHDAGDIQSIQHLEHIVTVCRNLPAVKFWLPTRERQTVEAYRRMGGSIPSNLCIRYSAHLVDSHPPLRYRMLSFRFRPPGMPRQSARTAVLQARTATGAAAAAPVGIDG